MSLNPKSVAQMQEFSNDIAAHIEQQFQYTIDQISVPKDDQMPGETFYQFLVHPGYSVIAQTYYYINEEQNICIPYVNFEVYIADLENVTDEVIKNILRSENKQFAPFKIGLIKQTGLVVSFKASLDQFNLKNGGEILIDIVSYADYLFSTYCSELYLKPPYYQPEEEKKLAS